MSQVNFICEKIRQKISECKQAADRRGVRKYLGFVISYCGRNEAQKHFKDFITHHDSSPETQMKARDTTRTPEEMAEDIMRDWDSLDCSDSISLFELEIPKPCSLMSVVQPDELDFPSFVTLILDRLE